MLVHGFKIFDKVEYIFPMRGHSYLPNDQDFSLIEKKKRKVGKAEVPEEWDKLILNARAHPSPFNLVKVNVSHMYNIKAATDPFFLKTAKPPVKIKDIRMLRIEKKSPLIFLRDNYHGPWRSSIVHNKVPIPEGLELNILYDRPNEIAPVKIQNLKNLMGFLEKPGNKIFYETIFSCSNGNATERPIDLDNEDNSSGCED